MLHSSWPKSCQLIALNIVILNIQDHTKQIVDCARHSHSNTLLEDGKMASKFEIPARAPGPARAPERSPPETPLRQGETRRCESARFLAAPLRSSATLISAVALVATTDWNKFSKYKCHGPSLSLTAEIILHVPWRGQTGWGYQLTRSYWSILQALLYALTALFPNGKATGSLLRAPIWASYQISVRQGQISDICPPGSGR